MKRKEATVAADLFGETGDYLPNGPGVPLFLQVMYISGPGLPGRFCYTWKKRTQEIFPKEKDYWPRMQVAHDRKACMLSVLVRTVTHFCGTHHTFF